MGMRNQWDDQEIRAAIGTAGGNLTQAASLLNAEKRLPYSAVSRQNLRTWLNHLEDYVGEEDVVEDADLNELTRKNRLLTNTNNELRREQRRTLDAQLLQSDMLAAIRHAVSSVSPAWPRAFPEKQPDGRGITIELLFSDLQIGKLMDGYDSDVAKARVYEWIEVATARIQNYMMQGYHVEKIILAILGDVIESDKKHDNSGRGCDIGTADQMKLAVELLFHNVIKRLAMFSVPMDVIAVTGNHDHDGHGLNMFYPGREHLSWPMYNALQMLSEEAGIDATFYIPEGTFHIHEIYGCKVLYEHGVGVTSSEASMRGHVGKRITQAKEFIDLFRMGDKHTVCRFNNDRLVVNGAFFGDDRIGSEFSGIKGYDGEPAQIMFAYVQRSDKRRTPVFDSLVIQLGHIG